MGNTPAFRLIYSEERKQYEATARLGADSYVLSGGLYNTEREAWIGLLTYMHHEIGCYLDRALAGIGAFRVERFNCFAEDGTMNYQEADARVGVIFVQRYVIFSHPYNDPSKSPGMLYYFGKEGDEGTWHANPLYEKVTKFDTHEEANLHVSRLLLLQDQGRLFGYGFGIAKIADSDNPILYGRGTPTLPTAGEQPGS